VANEKENTIDEEKSTEKSTSEEVGRRSFLMFLAGLSTVAVVGAGANIAKSMAPIEPVFPKWQKVKVANAKDLETHEPVIVEYPLEETPNILVKVGKKMEGVGVGPEGDIVAFSQICQHLGCFIRYEKPGRTGELADRFIDMAVAYCPCHGAFYDIVNYSKVVEGPPLYPLPFVKLEYDEQTGDIYAVGMNPPVIFGKSAPGSDDVTWDLIGGRLVEGEPIEEEGPGE